MAIEEIKARAIYDSRGNPTTEVELITDKGSFKASCPSGASTGASEACELRDGGKPFCGKGVTKAIDNIRRIIAPALLGMSVSDQAVIDNKMKELDGTPNKSKLGANAILPVSMAVCRAAAAEKGVPLYEHLASFSPELSSKPHALPYPCFNIINGGEHAGNALCVQEFMICPVGAHSFEEAMQMASETYHTLKGLLKSRYGQESVNVGDEGGFAPNLDASGPAASQECAGSPVEKVCSPSKKKTKNSHERPGLKQVRTSIEIILEAIEKAGYGGKIKLGMDAAATSFFIKGAYQPDYKVSKSLRGGEGVSEKEGMSSEEMEAFYEELVSSYPLFFIEDPMAEEDWEGFRSITEKLGSQKISIIGDDLLTTNPERIRKAVEKKACNALLLKLNQIGTVSEAVEAVMLAKKSGWKVMTSHRSGETPDDFIADLAVGLRTEMIKSGAPCRGERLAKYNRLLEIELELGEKRKMNENAL